MKWQQTACVSYSCAACMVGGKGERGASVGTPLASTECLTRRLKFVCACVCTCMYVSVRVCMCVCAPKLEIQCFNAAEGNFRLTSKSSLSHSPVWFIRVFACISVCACVCVCVTDVQKAGYQISCLWFCRQLLF